METWTKASEVYLSQSKCTDAVLSELAALTKLQSLEVSKKLNALPAADEHVLLLTMPGIGRRMSEVVGRSRTTADEPVGRRLARRR